MSRFPAILRYLPALAGVFLALFARIASGLEPPLREPVKIGIIAPITGGEMRRGADIIKMVSIFEERLSSSPKYRYEFIVEDGRCGAGNSATNAVMKLINLDKVKFLLTACSGETFQAGPIAQKAGVLTISVLALHPDVSKIGDYVFRAYIDVESSIERFSKYLHAAVPGKIAILTEENAFTFGIRDLLIKYLGEKISISEIFPMESTEFGTLLARAKRSGSEAVYFNAASEGTLANMVNDAVDQKLGMRIFTYAMPETASFRKATGPKGIGIEFLGTPEVSEASAEFRSFDEEFLRRNPEGASLHYLLRTTYDAVHIIVDGVNAVGNDPVKVKEYLKTYAGTGALGTVRFDAARNIKDQHFVLKRIEPDLSIKVFDTLDR